MKAIRYIKEMWGTAVLVFMLFIAWIFFRKMD